MCSLPRRKSMSKKATFIGHGECPNVNINEVRENIIDLIKNHGVEEFISGGMGNFDLLCAEIVHKLKENYPNIKSYVVIPYLNFNIRCPNYYDGSIYPEGFEKFYFKSAIIKRNKYLVDNSEYAVCYVNHNWGGAVKTYEYAKKKGLQIINLGKFL